MARKKSIHSTVVTFVSHIRTIQVINQDTFQMSYFLLYGPMICTWSTSKNEY